MASPTTSVESGPPPAAAGGGRIADWRARAERAGDRYQELARRRPVLGLPLAFLARYTSRQGMLLASAVAFRLFLWLMPLALLLAGAMAAVARDDPGTVRSAGDTAGITGAASQQIITALKEGGKSWWVAVLLGAWGLLWATRTLMRNLNLANAHAWQAPVRRPSLGQAAVTALLVGGAWAVLLFAAGLVTHLDHEVPGGVFLATVAETAAAAGMWLAIGLRLPDHRREWRDLLPGSVLFGVGLAVLHAVSRVYLPRRIEHASQLYGSLGVAISILAWLLLVGQLVVCSALTNSVWSEYRADRRAPPAGHGAGDGGGEAGGDAGEPAPAAS